jgi:large subunit ribosomal protein L31
MKSDIHPPYFPQAKVTCGCGTTFTVGSTKSEISVDICSHCHPFYTGKEKLIDTAGKVERFKARRAKAEAAPKTKAKLRVVKNKKV